LLLRVNIPTERVQQLDLGTGLSGIKLNKGSTPKEANSTEEKAICSSEPSSKPSHLRKLSRVELPTGRWLFVVNEA
jgi:hypothetical protein